MRNLPLCLVTGSAILMFGCAWGGPRGVRTSPDGGVVLGARVEKRCAKCNHIVSASAKPGEKCPYCGVIWGTETTSNRSGRAQSLASRGPVRASSAVAATVRPLSTTVSGRIKDFDAAINAQDGTNLSNIVAVNFVLLGKDGKVQLDGDRFIETAITDAVANSISRKSRLLSSRATDGEIVATVRVYSKRYPPDAKPEYTTTYERQTWTTEGLAPRLRLIEPTSPPKR